MTDYNDGKWHGWNGGECPVHPRSVVDVVLNTGLPDRTRDPIADNYAWDHIEYRPSHIVAFRVVKEYREPREFWIVAATGDAWGTEDHAKTAAEALVDPTIIHVREVLE